MNDSITGKGCTNVDCKHYKRPDYSWLAALILFSIGMKAMGAITAA